VSSRDLQAGSIPAMRCKNMGKNVSVMFPFTHRRQRVPWMRAWLEATPMWIVWSIACGLDSCISRQTWF